MRLPEWQNANSNRNFPFADNATMTLTNGYTVSQDVFVDFFAFVPEDEYYSIDSITINSSADLYLMLRSSTTSFGTIFIEDAYNTTDTEFELGDYTITGVVVLGEGVRQLIDQLGPGTYEFEEGGGRLASSAYSAVNVKTVTSVSIEGQSFTLIGDVKLIGENGIKFSIDGNNVTINAVADSTCENLFENKLPIKTINGLVPTTPQGVIHLLGQGIFKVRSGVASYHGESGEGVIIESMLEPRLGCPAPHRGNRGESR